MSDGRILAEMRAELPALPALLTAYARRSDQCWHALCWTLDQRLAAIVRRGGEPTIAAIKLAWWDAVLVEGDRTKGGGEPLVELWRVTAPTWAGALAERLIDGWRMLLSSEVMSRDDLMAFASKRGGALFGLISGLDDAGAASSLSDAGAAWALWDLAGHSRDEALAMRALDIARARLASGARLHRADAPKSLRLLYDLAAQDIRSVRVPMHGFEARHYRRLLWRSLLP